MKKSCIFIAFGESWSNNSRVPSQFKALADEISRKGILVVSLIQGKPDPKLAGENNIYYWPSKRPTNLRDVIFLVKLIIKYRPNCLITQFAATNIMLLIGWIMGIKYRLVWYHTLSDQINRDWSASSFMYKLLRIRKNFVYKFATNIIPVSKYALADFERTYHILNRTHVFYNGLKSMDKETPTRVITNKIICIARFDYSKGQDILIKAFRRVVDEVPDALLALVGDGKLKPEYKSLVSNLKLNDSVIFTGRVAPDEVMKLLFTSKISVLPSRMDNCPLAIIESLNAGVPVIASNSGGIPEILIDGVTGYLVKNEDIEAYSEKIIKVLTDPQLQLNLSNNARMDFLKRFEINKVISDQMTWLEQIGVI